MRCYFLDYIKGDFTSFLVASSQLPHVRRPLTDDVINHIAVNRLTHQISRLGLAMGFPLAMITKYEAENREEPRAESRGTKNMIQHWREACTASNQVQAFCAVLRDAQLNELAGDLSSGIIFNFNPMKTNNPNSYSQEDILILIFSL